MGLALFSLVAWTLVCSHANAHYGSERVHVDPQESDHDFEYFDFGTVGLADS